MELSSLGEHLLSCSHRTSLHINEQAFHNKATANMVNDRLFSKVADVDSRFLPYLGLISIP